MKRNQDDQFEDLKQYIDSRASQTEARFDEKIENLREEMQDGFAGVGEAIDEIHHQLEKRDAKVNKRLAKLEQAA